MEREFVTDSEDQEKEKKIGAPRVRYNSSAPTLIGKARDNISNALLSAAINTGGQLLKSLLLQSLGASMYFFSYDTVNYESALRWIYRKDKSKYMKNVKRLYTSITTKKLAPLDECNYFVKLSSKTYVNISYKRETKQNGSSYGILSIYVFGAEYPKYIKELTGDISLSIKKSNKITVINPKDNYDYYRTSYMDRRYFDTIFIDKESKTKILNHLHKWSKNSAMFKSRGILYKTGILLYGEPGTGKSTIARAIASELNASLMVIDMTQIEKLNISGLNDMISDFNNAPVVILLEDIDCVIKDRENKSESEIAEKKTMILNKLLQLLDGVNSINNVVFVATTNHYDQLDLALTRKSRFDLKEKIGLISRELAVDMCNSFKVDPNKVLDSTKDRFNPSDIQGSIMELL